MQKQNVFTGIKISADAAQKQSLQPKRQANEEDQFLSLKENTVIVRNKQNFKVFKFDACLGKTSSQQELYDNFCLSMVEDFVEGYDCTLVLCGQNKSPGGFNQLILGKDAEQTKGLIPRFIDQISNSIRYLSQRKFLFKVSFLEICEEDLIDLLGVKKLRLELLQDKKNKNQHYVSNLQIKPLQKIDEIEAFYLVGNRKKQYAYSKGYRKRQNSSLLFTVYLQSLEENSSIYRSSKFIFCELSYNSFQQFSPISSQQNLYNGTATQFVESNTFRATTFTKPHGLNLSNFAFQNVINTLVYGQQSSAVPFKDSKITKILRESFGGNCKTSILGVVSSQNQSRLPRAFKVLKTLQIASQIQNSPQNLKQYSEDLNQPGNQSIVQILQQIHHLSNQLDRTRLQLESILNSPGYVSQSVQKLKDQNGPSLLRQNQFCSQENLQNHFIEEKTKKQWELKTKIKAIERKLKEKVSYIRNLQNEDHIHKNSQVDQAHFQNQEAIILKRKQILLRVRNIKEQRLHSMPNLDIQQIQRQRKRQIFALEIQFQKQRSLYTSTIRNLQEKLSLYKKIAQNSLKSQEIEIIRANSKFDETKRQFQIPMFMIKDKKMRQGVASPATSERKFIVSPRSSSFNSYHSIKVSQFQGKNEKMGSKNSLDRIFLRKPAKDNESEYTSNIPTNREINDRKMGTKFNGFSKSKEIANRLLEKSPVEKRTNILRKRDLQRNKELNRINNVRSQYAIETVDIQKVIKYNDQRKRNASKQIFRTSKRQIRSPINLMRRQKLNTEAIVQNSGEVKDTNDFGSNQKKDHVKSPLKHFKRWM